MIEHYLAIVIAGQLNLHDDALVQLEADDAGWRGSLPAAKPQSAPGLPRWTRGAPEQIKSEIGALLDGLDAVHTAFFGPGPPATAKLGLLKAAATCPRLSSDPATGAQVVPPHQRARQGCLAPPHGLVGTSRFPVVFVAQLMLPPRRTRSSRIHSEQMPLSARRARLPRRLTGDRLIASDKIEGTAVYNRQGERLGSVYNFMVDKRSGQVEYAVLSFGGFSRHRRQLLSAAWKSLKYDTSQGGYVVDLDKDRCRVRRATSGARSRTGTTPAMAAGSTTSTAPSRHLRGNEVLPTAVVGS